MWICICVCIFAIYFEYSCHSVFQIAENDNRDVRLSQLNAALNLLFLVVVVLFVLLLL